MAAALVTGDSLRLLPLRNQVMIVTVVALIILVQVVQVLGDWLAKRADKRDRH